LSRVTKLLDKVLQTWKPAPFLRLSEWSDKYAYLSPESSHEPGKWRNIPYQPGIMDAFTDPTIERITLMKSARVGYTKILNNIIGYSIHYEPKSILAVQPTVEDAKGYSADEIAPMLRDTPCLEGLVSEARAKDSTNTILKKSYPGGFLSLVGANSPRGFRRISVPIVLFDEVDGYPAVAGVEGDQILFGIKRTTFFWNRKIVVGSTPTLKGLSRIETEFDLSDKRYYNVPCPLCNEMQVLEWGGADVDHGIKWPKDNIEKAYYLCKHCHGAIPESKKMWMLSNGQWIATEKTTNHAGFHIWAAYSIAPNATWPILAQEFKDVKGNEEKLKTFVNTTLGKVFEQKGSQPQWADIANRAEPYKLFELNNNIELVTAGVDTQDDRLAVCIHGWGPNEENWLIYWTEIYDGDQWLELDKLINTDIHRPDGKILRVVSVAVDTGGHRTQEVYNYCRGRGPRVIAIAGAKQRNRPIVGKPTKVDVSYHGKTIKNGVLLWHIGTDTAKKTIYSRLHNPDSIGTFHFPSGLDNEFYIQLTAEKEITRYVKGFPVLEWIKVNRRNEVLDCYVYSYAAAIRAGLYTIGISRPPQHRTVPTKKKTPFGEGSPFKNFGRKKLM